MIVIGFDNFSLKIKPLSHLHNHIGFHRGPGPQSRPLEFKMEQIK